MSRDGQAFVGPPGLRPEDDETLVHRHVVRRHHGLLGGSQWRERQSSEASSEYFDCNSLVA